MSSYIRNFIGPNERIIILAHLHWIYLVQGVVWMILLLISGRAFDLVMGEYIGSAISGVGQNVLGIYIARSSPLMLVCWAGAVFLFWLSTLLKCSPPKSP